jgi:hypothetical protein
MLKRQMLILSVLLLFAGNKADAQDSLHFEGQLSAYTHVNPINKLPWWSGARSIPQLNYKYGLKENRQIDFEASANLYGNMGIRPFDSTGFNGNVKPYRLWARYSTSQFELRAGLQKINFGSASILRPLMWFDQIDPRDPLKLTDGTWGLLARYYFLNNANIWLWGLYGNKNTKGWESFATEKKTAEYGGRLQLPVPKGEAGFSFHHRSADCSGLTDSVTISGKVPENRFGFDAKFDVVVGCWIEASWSKFGDDLGVFSNQEIINLGIDYTFSIGNGLTIIYEQLIAAWDEIPFRFTSRINFSLLSLSYPVGLFDNLNAIVYYDWTNSRIYNFVNWQKRFNKVTLYLMGYINPREYNIPTQVTDEILYAGSGIQLMVVFNH